MSEKNSRIEEYRERYQAACHAMQTGVAFTLDRNPSSGTPKHLRVGVNSAMVEHGALAKLLFSKGVITEEEYYRELCEGMEREAESYQKAIQEMFGGASVRLA